ncbi:MAG TPA: hypothetical protein VKB27_06320 [Gammaproteobacteria bacterium]|nr:hypothetical protein [Gammaproteobacteria bacterium]
MKEEADIPTLTDLIDEADGSDHIAISDLGLEDEDIEISSSDLIVADPFLDNPALEQTVRRILDEHMELAWQEIKLAIQQELNKS